MKKSLILIMLLCYKFSFSQTKKPIISGTVTSENGKPLDGVIIGVDSLDLTQTDSLGHFIINNISLGDHLISASSLGKRNIRIPMYLKANDSLRLEIQMIDNSIQLDDVLVKGKLRLNFKSIADLPYIISNSYYVSDDSCIYLINGVVGGRTGLSTKILKYNPRFNNWAVLADKLIPKFDCSAAFIPKTGKIYIFGGTDPSGRLNSFVESVDVKNGETKRLKVINPLLSSYGGCVEFENKLYVFGGSRFNGQNIANTGIGLNDLYEFDPIKEQFKKLASMPIGMETSGVVFGKFLYTFGGYNPFLHQSFNIIQRYDFEKNFWEKIGHLTKSISATDVCVYKNLIFLVGSYDDEFLIQSYNPLTQEIKEIKSNMKPRKHAAAGIFQNRYLVVFGSSIKSDNAGTSSQVVDLQQYFR